MKIIFDNIIFSLQKSGGISILWQNLLSKISETKEFKTEFIEYPYSINNIFSRQLKIPIDKIDFRSGRILSIKRYFPPKIKCTEPFIFHSSYYRTSNSSKAINITTVHDFTYEKYFPFLKRIIHSWQKFKAKRKSDYIVCISENTKSDLLNYIPDIDSNKIRIIYNGVSSDYCPLSQKPYPNLSNSILFIGSRVDYKNFDYTIECIQQSSFNLVICGNRLSNEEQIKLDTKLGPDRYQVVENPDNHELNKIYNSVFCLSYPSSYEGFGIPVIEAQKAGCPVIALNKSSIPEIIGNGYPMLRDLTQAEFNRIINQFKNPDIRNKIISLGYQNSSKFSWEKMIQEYTDLYLEISSLIKQ